jgi:hypothetical protein
LENKEGMPRKLLCEVDFPDEIFYIIILMLIYLISLGLGKMLVCRTSCFMFGLTELNVIIPLMVLDRMIINCGLPVEQGVEPDY